MKWGIAAAGRISDEFTNALSALEKQNHQVAAIAARDLGRAEEFAKRFDIPKAYGSYLELAKDPNVEVVYIGVLNPQHFEVSMVMLEHGKHVLCEKPLCINEKLARKLIEYAESKKLFLMEGIIQTYVNFKLYLLYKLLMFNHFLWFLIKEFGPDASNHTNTSVSKSIAGSLAKFNLWKLKWVMED